MSAILSSVPEPALSSSWAILQAALEHIADTHPDAVFASSLGAEDMVLAHAIFAAGLPIQVFTLDTGRLHAETLALIQLIEDRYGVAVRRIQPDPASIKAHVDAHGAYAFYESMALRKECCALRKVEPLRRALQGHSAWLTGQRRSQSLTRTELPESEFDPVFGLWKYNPLASWTQEEVWSVIRRFGIPYNPLHDRGYPSIGCEPCTRAVRPGEDERAGRWWWEQKQSKECGLHAGNLKD
ncbi:phosphoadenylyl-sulfate reductase [Pollutimonas sp. H1-120]|uniref:phosphoadenylyl-sulfate reductase n=1 Tax=Pollutimonas sp. H1-120 TaxID=3148824 RepID=UPI003B51DB64